MFSLHFNSEVFKSDNYVVVDFETTNIEKGSALEPSNRMVLARWRLGKDHPHALGVSRDRGHWGDEFGQADLLRDIEEATFIVAHNAKFELQWLKRCGLNLRKVLPYCTMIGEKVLAGNRKRQLSLEATAGRRGLGTKACLASALIQAEVCPSLIPADSLEEYCHNDVVLTEAVFLRQRKELWESGQLSVAYCRNVVTPALADIEFRGMCLDPERVGETYAEYGVQYSELLEKFREFAGGINPKSNPQMAEFLYDKLGFKELTDRSGAPLRGKKTKKNPEGGRKVGKEVIAALKASTDEQRAFLKVFRELIKFKTPVQNLKKMKGIVDKNPQEPIVYASYNQTVVATDRLSSTGRRGGFQFHNFDRAFKKLFRARKDSWLVVEGDAPQLEFRVAVDLGQDETGRRDIRDGVDVHANTQKVVKAKDRTDAKKYTFRPLYGGNSGTPREKAYYQWFRDRYKGIYSTQKGWTYAVAKDKVLVTPWGHKFWWPEATMSADGYVSKTTEIFNYPIQSFATADIIPLCLTLVWHAVEPYEDHAWIVNTIHDSIVAEVELAYCDTYKAILRKAFTVDIYRVLKELYGYEFKTDLGVGIKVAPFWADTKHEEKAEGKSPFYS